MSRSWNYDGPWPEGVPNPYVPQIEIYPSYVHGADYTRPVFAMPFYLNPHNVLNGIGLGEEVEVTTEVEHDLIAPRAYIRGILTGVGALAAIGGILGGISAPNHRNAGTGILLGALGGALLGLIPAAATAIAIKHDRSGSTKI